MITNDNTRFAVEASTTTNTSIIQSTPTELMFGCSDISALPYPTTRLDINPTKLYYVKTVSGFQIPYEIATVDDVPKYITSTAGTPNLTTVSSALTVTGDLTIGASTGTPSKLSLNGEEISSWADIRPDITGFVPSASPDGKITIANANAGFAVQATTTADISTKLISLSCSNTTMVPNQAAGLDITTTKLNYVKTVNGLQVPYEIATVDAVPKYITSTPGTPNLTTVGSDLTVTGTIHIFDGTDGFKLSGNTTEQSANLVLQSPLNDTAIVISENFSENWISMTLDADLTVTGNVTAPNIKDLPYVACTDNLTTISSPLTVTGNVTAPNIKDLPYVACTTGPNLTTISSDLKVNGDLDITAGDLTVTGGVEIIEGNLELGTGDISAVNIVANTSLKLGTQQIYSWADISQYLPQPDWSIVSWTTTYNKDMRIFFNRACRKIDSTHWACLYLNMNNNQYSSSVVVPYDYTFDDVYYGANRIIWQHLDGTNFYLSVQSTSYNGGETIYSYTTDVTGYTTPTLVLGPSGHAIFAIGTNNAMWFTYATYQTDQTAPTWTAWTQCTTGATVTIMNPYTTEEREAATFLYYSQSGTKCAYLNANGTFATFNPSQSSAYAFKSLAVDTATGIVSTGGASRGYFVALNAGIQVTITSSYYGGSYASYIPPHISGPFLFVICSGSANEIYQVSSSSIATKTTLPITYNKGCYPLTKNYYISNNCLYRNQTLVLANTGINNCTYIETPAKQIIVCAINGITYVEVTIPSTEFS
jgi:hypothetical protein